ncbi:hypothetical protein KI387_043417, partial [Taxus chinensis]
RNSRLGVTIWQLFQYADWIDRLMMFAGSLGAVGDGLYHPSILVIMSSAVNGLGSGLNSMDNLNQARI